MQAVCDILEQLSREGVLRQYAIGEATAAGFHGEPLATRDVDVFVFVASDIAILAYANCPKILVIPPFPSRNFAHFAVNNSEATAKHTK